MSLNELLMSLELGLIYGIVAIGVYLTFRVIDFSDLTCDGSFVLGAAISTAFIKIGMHPGLSLIAALVSGAIAGSITGLLCVRFRVTHLLSGILVSFMLYSINLRIMGGIPNISLLNHNTLFAPTESPLIKLSLISLSICIIISYLLKTDFGLALRSIGQNKILAQNSGVNTSLIMIIGLALSNALIALGGALFSQHQGFADIGSSVGTVIVGLTSVMIGEKITPYQSIFAKILFCLIGSIIYRLFISFALYSDILGLSTTDLNLITGLMVIAIMYFAKRQGVVYAKT